MELRQRNPCWTFPPSELPRFEAEVGVRVARLFHTLSAAIPAAEGYIVRVAKRALDERADLPAHIRTDLELLAGQEIAHSRLHRAYNTGLEEAGFPVKDYRKEASAIWSAHARSASLEEQAAVVAYQECRTVCFAVWFSRHIRRHLRQPYESWTPHLQFAYWHGQEEIEHADAASDLLQVLVPDPDARHGLKKRAARWHQEHAMAATRRHLPRFMESASRRARLRHIAEVPRLILAFRHMDRRSEAYLHGGSISQTLGPREMARYDPAFLHWTEGLA